MRAIQIQEHGGPEVMKVVDLPVREPGPTEVRIRHHAIGVNFIDTYQRAGLYKQPMPFIPGSEGAGVVEAAGANARFAVGDRVAYAANTAGSYAETRVIDSNLVVKLPDAISFEAAAAMMLKGLTVQYLLRRTWPLKKGDHILWHAAAGGVGLIACQWAKALGLHLIGTAGGPDKCALARGYGAEAMIDYHADDFVARVREIVPAGVAVAFDSVGKDTVMKSLACIRPLGLLVSFGNASGAPAPLDILELSRRGSLYVHRPTLGAHTTIPGALELMAVDLFEIVLSGQVKIEVNQRWPLEQAAEAHRALEGKHTTGATILTL
ncbi:MAG: quinone oxidoreductase [Kofleriaceae bacterium]